MIIFMNCLTIWQMPGEPISTRSAIRQFIFMLGSEFESIQNNYRVKVLPSEWYIDDWPTILALCRDYYNSVKPKGLLQKGTPNEPSGDRVAYQKKIRDWWLNLAKFCQLIEAEQAKHPGKCLYHLTKSHQSTSCAVKKECDHICEKIMAKKKAGLQTSTTSGHLRHIMELTEEDELDVVATPDTLSDTPSNDTNEADLHYFVRLSNHYLRLVKSNYSASVDCLHNLRYPIIADSGANFHMFKHPEFLTTMQPLAGYVILGDGQTTLPIQGIGTMSCIIDGHSLLLHDVRFVPQLSESIYSLLQHIKQPNYGLHSSSTWMSLWVFVKQLLYKICLGHLPHLGNQSQQ